MTIVIDEEDLKEYIRLYRTAQNTPVILVQGVDVSAAAWAAHREFGIKLAKKDVFVYEKNAIDGSGEVIPI